MAKAATAYVVIVPDLDNFADQLRAGLERVKAPTFEVDIKPNFEHFSQDVRDTLANDQNNLPVPVEPDFEGIHQKIKAEIQKHRPYPTITLPVDLDSKPIERALQRIAANEAKRATRRAGDEIGKSLAGSIASSLVKNMSKVGDGMAGVLLNPFVLPVVAGAALLATQFALAFIGGLTAAMVGVGFAGLAGFLLKGEPEVKAAGTRLGAAFTTTWATAAKGSMGGIISALDIVTSHVENAGHQAAAIFDAIAGPIVGLGRSIGAAIDDIMNSLSLNVDGISEGIAGFGDLVESVGVGIASAFDTILDDPEELRRALMDLGLVLRQVIAAIGELISWGVKSEQWARTWVRNLMDINEAFTSVFFNVRNFSDFQGLWDDWTGKTDAAREAALKTELAADKMMDALTARARGDNPAATMDQVAEAIANVGQKFKGGIQDTQAFSSAVNTELRSMQLAIEQTNWQKFAEDAKGGFQSVDQSVKDTRKEVDDLIESLDLLNNRFISKEQARINFKKTLRDMADAVKEGKTGLNENTEAGLKNKGMMIQATRQVAEFVQKSLENGDSLKQVASNVNGLSAALLAQGGKLAGNKTLAQAYITQLEATPKQIFTDLAMQGVPGAQEALDELTKDKTVNITPEIKAEAFKGIWTDRDPELKNAGAGMSNVIATQASDTLKAAIAADPGFQAAGAKAAEGFAVGVTSAKPQVATATSALTQQLSDGLGNAFSAAYSAGQMAGSGLVSGLYSQSGYVYSAFISFTQNYVNQAIADGLKTESPSKVTYGYGQMAAIGLAEGIDDKASAVKSSAQNLYKQLGRPPTMSGAVEANGGSPQINARIYVGDRELVDIVKTEASYADQRSARALYYGRRVG